MQFWVILIIIVLAVVVMTKIARRSGVSRHHLLKDLPGDELIGEAGFITDRARLIHASAEEVWPLLIRLGDKRIGWRSSKRLLEVIEQHKPRDVVYAFQKDDEHPEQYVFSWAHVIEPIDDTSCKLYSRFRMRRSERRLMRTLSMFLPVGGLYDYLVTALLYAGLQWRLEK